MTDDCGQPVGQDGDGRVSGLCEGRLVLAAEELFCRRQEVEIHLGGTVYRLRLTRAGKLILTK